MMIEEHERPRENEDERLIARLLAASGRDRRVWLILTVIVLAVVLVGYLLISSHKTSSAGEEETALTVVSVRVAKAERGPINAETTLLGTIFPAREATVAAKIAGQIKSMALLRNKTFKEGEVIATLESRDLQAQRAEAAAALEEARANERSVAGGSIPQTAAQDEKAVRDAEANLANARATLERRRILYEQGGISRKDLDASQLAVTTAENELRLAESTARLHATTISPNDRTLAQAKVNQAQERLASLDTQLGYATIRAPFPGVVIDQFQFQGEFAAPGAKLFEIADTSELIVKAPVADTVAAQLKIGDSATVRPQDLQGEEIPASVSLISRSSDPQSRAVEIWIKLKNKDGRLRPDSAAKVVVSTNSTADAVIVPLDAVTLDTTNADDGTVMVVDSKSIARETKVKVGIRAKDKIEITSGLSGGETVVIEGNYALPDKTKVEVIEGEEEGDKSGDKDNDEKDKK